MFRTDQYYQHQKCKIYLKIIKNKYFKLKNLYLLKNYVK